MQQLCVSSSSSVGVLDISCTVLLTDVVAYRVTVRSEDRLCASVCV